MFRPGGHSAFQVTGLMEQGLDTRQNKNFGHTFVIKCRKKLNIWTKLQKIGSFAKRCRRFVNYSKRGSFDEGKTNSVMGEGSMCVANPLHHQFMFSFWKKVFALTKSPQKLYTEGKGLI